MEVSKLQNGLSLQGTAAQAKSKTTEASIQTLSSKVKNLEQLQHDLALNQKKIQESNKSEKERSRLEEKRKHLYEVVKDVQERLNGSGVKIRIEKSEETGKEMLVIRNPETDEILHTLPPEIYFKMIEALKQSYPQPEYSGTEVDVKY